MTARGCGPSWNPLSCDGTALPPNVLLMAKLLVVFLLCRGAFSQLSDHFLPFLPFFDYIGTPQQFRTALQVVCGTAAAGLLFNRAVRACAFTLGLTLLISILSSRALFSNNRTFVACLLLLAGLSERGQAPWLVRAQVVMLYLGSGLNKLLDPDWRTGQFIEFWMHEILNQGTYQALAAQLPPMRLSAAAGWLAIATELGLAVLFLRPRWYGWAIRLGILFHTAMLVVTHGQLSVVFYYATLASYLAFVRWPERPLVVRSEGGWAVDVDGVVYAGAAGAVRLLAYSPAAYAVFAVLIAHPGRLAPWPVYWAALAVPVACAWLTRTPRQVSMDSSNRR